MRTIKVTELQYDLKAMYNRASTISQRGLLGYMVKAGITSDTLFGGAFAVVCAVENCSGLYRLYPCCDTKENEKKILYIAECALNGEWNDMALSRKEIEYNLKRMKDYM